MMTTSLGRALYAEAPQASASQRTVAVSETKRIGSRIATLVYTVQAVDPSARVHGGGRNIYANRARVATRGADFRALGARNADASAGSVMTSAVQRVLPTRW